MRPLPFKPERHGDDERYVNDKSTGLIWHRVQSRTLYADTDRSGVVYHANYFRYFELGRVTLMRDLGYSYFAVEESGYIYPVVEVGLKFFKSLFYDDPMWIHTRPAALERVRVRFDYAITHADTGELICQGFTTHCALSAARRPVAVDAQTVKIWKQFPQ
jgi:acyl-CoA thioester hydrolase